VIGTADGGAPAPRRQRILWCGTGSDRGRVAPVRPRRKPPETSAVLLSTPRARPVFRGTNRSV